MNAKQISDKSIISNKRGAALVEMALIVSLLFVLLFGLIDFGLLLKDYLALSQVSREASRSAAVGSSMATINSRISTWCSSVGLDYSDLEPTIVFTDPNTGEVYPLGDSGTHNDAPMGAMISVTLEYPHQMIAGGLFGVPDNWQLQTTMVTRRE
ncbi:MAG TPA: pilus assembly protein [Armatimonadota bacterium]|nr:pilus assembly protein [Armatimonadota bacterium]HPP75510.1 pilus assembly protein [Armatimonadota bacterium]